MEIELCYVFTSAGIESDSVQKKVIAQINALNLCGVKCRGAFFTTEVKEEISLTQNITLIPYEKTNRKYFNPIKQKRILISKVSEYMTKTIKKREYIYLRYPGASLELYLFAKKHSKKIVSEHQSKEIDEIRSSKNEHPFGLNVNKLLSHFLYQIWPIVNEKIWGKGYSRNLKAKVAVTHEIAEYHKKSCNVWMISNGIETINYKVRAVPELNNVLKILFLKGASNLAPWYGLDRLIKSIDAFESSSIKIQLIICGNVNEGDIPERSFIIQKGYLNSEELDQLFSIVHIGFSSLCLYRINLTEAAVLKSREYFARGLPFVYGYTDPDIDKDDSINNYIFQVKNDDSIINFNEVIDFAQRISKDSLHPQKMRIFAEEKLDWKIKMSCLKNYLID